jgi:hypothetical protein
VINEAQTCGARERTQGAIGDQASNEVAMLAAKDDFIADLRLVARFDKAARYAYSFEPTN